MSIRSWPKLDYNEWMHTGDAIHLWLQIVGKYRLARTPWTNHSWHATTYVTPRGLTTGLVPDGPFGVTIEFDFFDHVLRATAGSDISKFALEEMSVADFHLRFIEAVKRVGGDPTFHGSPNELPDPIPFDEDTKTRLYNAVAVEKYHAALIEVDRVFNYFRTGYLGKVSPVHLFWGAMDLAVTRFSGRTAPRHAGGIPHLPDAVTVEAYSHEVSSAGFWAGGGGVDEAMFYSYAYPASDAFANSPVRPDQAWFDERLGEFLLPYRAVASSDSPRDVLLEFLQSTYVAAANTALWDRAALECEFGRLAKPREV